MNYHDTRGYKYTTAESFTVFLPLFLIDRFRTDFAHLSCGKLNISAGYAWDGASGPTWDTPATMVPSLVHDVLYQGIREGLLPASRRFDADLTFYRLMRERTSGFWGHLRAFYFFAGVRLGGWLSIRPRSEGEAQTRVLIAP